MALEEATALPLPLALVSTTEQVICVPSPNPLCGTSSISSDVSPTEAPPPTDKLHLTGRLGILGSHRKLILVVVGNNIAIGGSTSTVGAITTGKIEE